MSTATQERTIDGLRFSVTQLPAMRSVLMLNRLNRLFGPAFLRSLAGANIGSVLSGGGAAALKELLIEGLADSLQALTERLSDKELEDLTRTLLETATVEGRMLMPEFDLTMQGRVGTVFKLIAFAVEVNYRGFFSGLLANVARPKTASGSAGSAPGSTRAGPAGGSSSSESRP